MKFQLLLHYSLTQGGILILMIQPKNRDRERCKIEGMVENFTKMQFFRFFVFAERKWGWCMQEICNWRGSNILGENWKYCPRDPQRFQVLK